MKDLKNLPSMPFLVEKYLKKTKHLSLEEHGAYFLLLCHMWQAGGTLAENDGDLARLLGATPAKWKRLRERVGPFFESHGGILMQGRLQEQWNYATEHSVKAKEKASFAAKRRWEKEKGLKTINSVLQAMPQALLPASSKQCPKQCSSNAILKKEDIPLPLSNTVGEVLKKPIAQSTAVEMPDIPPHLNRLLNTNLMKRNSA